MLYWILKSNITPTPAALTDTKVCAPCFLTQILENQFRMMNYLSIKQLSRLSPKKNSGQNTKFLQTNPSMQPDWCLRKRNSNCPKIFFIPIKDCCFITIHTKPHHTLTDQKNYYCHTLKWMIIWRLNKKWSLKNEMFF